MTILLLLALLTQTDTPTLPAPTSQAAQAPAPITRHLAPGDRIRVMIGNQAEDFTINPDGEILVKGLDAVRVEGMTTAQLATTIDLAVRVKGITGQPVSVLYLSSPAPEPKQVEVFGAVQNPGTHEAFTVIDAIRSATPDTIADLDHAVLIHAGDSTPIAAATAARGETTAPPLAPGDRILIPAKPAPDTPQLVTVLGDIAKPGQYPPGNLTTVLAAAGGPKTTARLSAIQVRTLDGHATTHNLNLITIGRQPDPQLPPNSTVFVESDEPRRQKLSDFRTLVTVISVLVAIGLRL